MQESTKKIFDDLVRKLNPVWGSDEALQIARLLCKDQFGWQFSTILADKQVEISTASKNLLQQKTHRLLCNEPIQYVLGQACFLGRTFFVNENVLVPRPETEELVMLIKQENTRSCPKILDIGTGSGCIAISLALEIPGSEVTAWDVRPEILEVAHKNAKSLSAKVHFQEQDIFEINALKDRFDIIVSNPPYVTESEKAGMKKNVLGFEPFLALFVPDEDPLAFYHKITCLASSALSKGGKLYFEINERFGNALKIQIGALGFKTFLKRDIHGKDRMISAVYTDTKTHWPTDNRTAWGQPN